MEEQVEEYISYKIDTRHTYKVYVNSKDKYNAISVIAIMDYEKVENDVVAEQQAYENYRENLNSMDEFDSELPF